MLVEYSPSPKQGLSVTADRLVGSPRLNGNSLFSKPQAQSLASKVWATTASTVKEISEGQPPAPGLSSELGRLYGKESSLCQVMMWTLELWNLCDSPKPLPWDAGSKPEGESPGERGPQSLLGIGAENGQPQGPARGAG